ncbi:MAG: TonB-dependent receptor [Thermodesulfobacteriota bacterium]
MAGGWKHVAFLLLVVCLLFSAAQQIQAEESGNEKAPYVMEQITVTAEKIEEKAQDVPASVTVYTEDQITNYGVDDTEKLFQKTPNIHMVKSGPKASLGNFGSMRGISFMHGTSPSFGFYVDDVYYSNFDVSLFDVERIEVLKGPQGTLYGRNAESGVVNIVTKKPSNEWTTSIKAGTGTYGARDVSATLGGPIISDTLAFRFSGRYSGSEGFFYNTAKDQRNADRSDDFDGRLTLHLTPQSDWNVLLNMEFQDYFDNYAEFRKLDGIYDNPHDVSLSSNGLAQKQAGGGSLRLEKSFDDVKLVSVSAIRMENTRMENDGDFTSSDISMKYSTKEYSLFSQEVRLSSDHDRPFQWLLGAYAFYEDDDLSTWMVRHTKPLGSFVQDGDTTTNGMAGFARMSYTFWEKLTLTAGLRYDFEHKDYDYAWQGGSFLDIDDQAGSTNKTFEAWLPKFSVDYKFTPDVMAYASVSRGFKSGGFNLKSDPGKPYDAEYTLNYETGLKTQWFGNRLQANLSVFYIDWDNQQVEIASYPNFTIVNAAKSTSKGFEIDLRAWPITGLECVGGFGYTFSTFDEFTDDGVSYAGKRNPNIPLYTGYLGATYRFQNGFFVNADYNLTGDYVFDLTNSIDQQAYHIINAKVGFARDKFEISIWGKNLLNSVYVTRAFLNGTQWYGRAGDPLTFGIDVSYKF